MSARPAAATAPISRGIAREAARWFVRLQGNASEPEREACARWRASNTDHERAWQLAARFHAQANSLSAAGVQALQRSRGVGRRNAVKLLSLLMGSSCFHCNFGRQSALINLLKNREIKLSVFSIFK